MGEEEAVKNTVLEKPLRLANVMMTVPEELAGMLRELGLPFILKSTTLTVKMMEWVKGPLIPTTVRA